MRTSTTLLGNSRGDLFENLFPILYSVEGSISGTYLRQSRISALLAELMTGGLAGKDVLDLGCGYGTTTLALSGFEPGSITAIDNSRAMTEMMHLLFLEDGGIEEWLNSKGARSILGRRFDRTLKFLTLFRNGFRLTNFWKERKDRLEILCLSLFGDEEIEIGPFDAAIANNMLHWPITQLKGKLESVQECTVAVLKKVRKVLKSGQTFVFMEPKQLVRLEESREKGRFQLTATTHPVFTKLNQKLNQLLKEKYGIDREMPQNVDLFRTEEMADIARQSGFEVTAIKVIDEPTLVEPLEIFSVILPINLGTVDLPISEKVSLIAETAGRLEIPEDQRLMPLRDTSVYFVLRAV